MSIFLHRHVSFFYIIFRRSINRKKSNQKKTANNFLNDFLYKKNKKKTKPSPINVCLITLKSLITLRTKNVKKSD